MSVTKNRKHTLTLTRIARICSHPGIYPRLSVAQRILINDIKKATEVNPDDFRITANRERSGIDWDPEDGRFRHTRHARRLGFPNMESLVRAIQNDTFDDPRPRPWVRTEPYEPTMSQAEYARLRHLMALDAQHPL
jgi:hypothetical protein